MAEHDSRTDDAGIGHECGDIERVVPPSRSSTVGREVWQASASFGWLIGTILLLVAAAVVVLLIVRIPSATGGQRVAWIALAAALTALTIGIAIVLRALPTMRYRLTDEALIVEWLGERRVVPYGQIGDITFEPHRPFRLNGWEPFWPGYYVATVRTPGGTWHSWATQQPQRRVRISTPHGIVAISPERPVRFVTELERRIGAADHLTEASLRHTKPAHREPPRQPTPPPVPSRTSTLPSRARRQSDANGGRRPVVGWIHAYRDLFRDQVLADQVSSALVAAGVVLPVLMVAYLYSQYEGLPAQIPVRWDATGVAAELTSPGGLWRFPRIAITILVVNTMLATLLIAVDRHLSRLLLVGVPVAQVILFVALIRAVN